MNPITDEKLEALLSDYYDSEPQEDLVYRPDSRKRGAPDPFVKNNRIWAAAASLVLVSVLSIVLYFLLGNKINTPIAVAPPLYNATIPSAPEKGTDSAETVQSSTAAEEGQTEQGLLIPSTEISEGGSINALHTAGNRTDGTDAASAAAEDPDPTQPAADSETLAPTAIPSQPAETQQPEIPSTQPPTLPPRPVWPVWPTINQNDGDESLPLIGISDSFRAELLSEGAKVYCRIYDADNRLLGDSDLYSAQHLANVKNTGNGMLRVSYYPKENGLTVDSDSFYYCFYDENGFVLCRGQK